MTRRAKEQPGFSLFPFLAVLLCTMASLIVLLLILVNQGRLAAAAVESESSPVPQYESPSTEQLAAQLAEQQRLGELAQQLAKLRGQLQEQFQTTQFDLSHLDDHIRRLRDELAQLEADYNVIKQSTQAETETREAKLARLHALSRQIADAERELDDAKKQAAARPRSFAIIPYDGPSGTQRRPIYIECCKDQVILQPEGTVLLPQDFRPPLDAGNPLAAALRATREYWLNTGALQGSEPYPLLVVRPDGAEMYTAARNAMASWSTEYGYELVEADMQLEFPPADEALGDIVRRTVDVSRQRHANLALRRGGFEAGDGQGGAQRGRTPRGAARPFSASSSYSGDGPYAVASRNGGFQVHGQRPDPLLDQHLGPREGYAGSGSLPSVGNIRSGATGGSGSGGAASGVNRSVGPAPAASGGFYPPEQPRSSAAQNQNQLNGTELSGSTTPQHSQTRPTPTSGQAAGTSPQNANNNPFAPADEAGGAPGGTSMESRGAEGSPGASSGRIGSNMETQPQLTEKEFNALADARGDDWALPNSSRGATPFTRPIRIECHADKLIVLPDRGTTGAAKTVRVAGELENSIDTLVGHLWNHMKGWGMAGPTAYWKPLLSVHVAPGGEDRFAELSALMQRSGVDVEWKR